jgi:hypothetical protein
VPPTLEDVKPVGQLSSTNDSPKSDSAARPSPPTRIFAYKTSQAVENNVQYLNIEPLLNLRVRLADHAGGGIEGRSPHPRTNLSSG